MPNQPKRPSSRLGKPTNRKTTVGKSSPRSRMGKSPQSRKRTVAGGKFSHRPYKPRKPKAKKPRTADSILKEARAARKALVQKGSVQPWARQASRRAPAEAPTYQPPARQAFERPKTPPAQAPQSTADHIYQPILQALGNPPVIASGHGQYDSRAEVWVADDFYVIVEADPECVDSFGPEQIGFRYLMTASCFYRESRNPHPHAPHHPILIFTLEHSKMLLHSDPGFFDRLLGKEAKPLSMVVALFTHNARHHFNSVSYDEDFTRGRQRLLGMIRNHLGISEHFDRAGHFTSGQINPAMK